MLVLRRKVGEKLILEVDGIAEPIEIMLVKIESRQKARIGVTAPGSVKVYREEIKPSAVDV